MNDINIPNASFTTNIISFEQWDILNNAGVVFMPASGYRYCDGSVFDVGINGNYWSSTSDGSSDAYYFYFNSNNVVMSRLGRGGGNAVRLVHDYNAK